jgi:hypothetical protein
MSRIVIKNLHLHLYQIGDKDEWVVGEMHEDTHKKEIAITPSNVHCVSQVILKAKE